MKKIFSITIPIFLFFLLISPASAAIFQGGDQYYLGPEETIEDNVYLGGGNLVINGNIDGDLIVGGGSILANGDVSKDRTIAGGNITINGNTGDDLRTAGGTIILNGNVDGELTIAGGQITVSPNVIVGKNAYIGGGVLIIDGKIEGDLEIAGGQVELNGEVTGNVKAIADEKISLGKNAIIGGNFEYSAPKEAELSEEALISGELIFNQIESEVEKIVVKKDVFGDVLSSLLAGLFLLKLLIALVFALILFFVFENPIVKMAKHAIENPQKFGKEFLRGFVIIIVTPIALLLVLATIIGSPFTFVGFLILGLLLVFAKTGGAIILGSLILKVFKAKKFVSWQGVLIGVVLASLLRIIPIFGWAICATFFLTALGTLSLFLYRATVKGLK